jgi:hypothetical protein
MLLSDSAPRVKPAPVMVGVPKTRGAVPLLLSRRVSVADSPTNTSGNASGLGVTVRSDWMPVQVRAITTGEVGAVVVSVRVAASAPAAGGVQRRLQT